MTDAEIAKAKAHFEYGIKADIFAEPVLSYAKTVLEAFDIINSQNAEIERLKELLKGWKTEAYKVADEKDKLYCEAVERVKTTKAEAIKEFAELLKNKALCIPQCHFTYADVEFVIDKLVKEIELLDTEDYYCEYCCNFDKEHIGMDGTALCKLTNTLAYCEACAKDCKFFNIPAADVAEVKRGKWIKTPYSEKDGDSHCSECSHFDWSDCDYCSYCGAKMDGDGK